MARLKAEISLRENLFHQLMAEFGTKQVQLQDRINKLSYISLLPHGFQCKQDAEAQMLRLQEMRLSELENSFRDLFELKEKFEKARHDLQNENLRLSLTEL